MLRSRFFLADHFDAYYFSASGVEASVLIDPSHIINGLDVAYRYLEGLDNPIPYIGGLDAPTGPRVLRGAV